MGWSSDDIQLSIVLLEGRADGALIGFLTGSFELAAASAKDCKKRSCAKKVIAMSRGERQFRGTVSNGSESGKSGRYTSATLCFAGLDVNQPLKV